MPITPTVLGAATIKGETVLVVAAGEYAESLKFVNVEMKENSAEAIQEAFVTACSQLGYGQPGGGGDREHADAQQFNAGQEQQVLSEGSEEHHE